MRSLSACSACLSDCLPLRLMGLCARVPVSLSPYLSSLCRALSPSARACLLISYLSVGLSSPASFPLTRLPSLVPACLPYFLLVSPSSFSILRRL
jgi:hypothetical protein